VNPVVESAQGLLDLVVGEVAHGGWCVAREPGDTLESGGRVVFVRHALPGERVLAQVTDATARFARADAVRILEASPDRVEPRCPHARPGGCGGCDWQHASLDAQRRLKAAVISQQLRRIAGIEREVTVEALPGDDAGLHWRTRVRFAMRPDGIAGLRQHRSHEVVDVGDCPIAHPLVSAAGATGQRWEGARSVEVVTSPGSGERALIISPAAGRRPANRQARRPAGSPAHPPATRPPTPPNEPGADSVPSGRARSGFGHVGSSAGAGRETGPGPAGESGQPGVKRYAPSWVRREADSVLTAGGGGLTPLRGHGSLRQTAAGRTWRVSAGAFWQVHPGAADALTAAVLGALQPEPGDVALDLYCGAGLFAGVLAAAVGPAGAVAAVESDPAAVRDAKHNLRGTPWARVYRGDAAEVLARGGWPEAGLAVLDPPRTGAARPVIERLLAPSAGESRLRRVAYVSCDPATLARDLAVFAGSGWRLAALRAFDAFPMTHHVECVATLLPE
jgi:tRNA/tmRNA/rRNA uracil-C5-methylase (TrmA/RlmC/RlmD family)